MKIRPITAWTLLATLITHADSFSFPDCNVTRSCWFHPPACTASTPEKCVSGVEWEVRKDGVFFQLQSLVSDLDPTRPHYIAVGISLNQRMDDDTVLDCIRRADGDARMQISFNDETRNHVLYQASTVLVAESTVTFVDGLLTCSAVFRTGLLNQINETDKFKIHDLQVRPYYLLFSRGNADTYSLEKEMHYMNDGPKFPWMSGEMVSFCSENCTMVPAATPVHITSMLQSKMERYWRYRIAVIHGVAMLIGWWVLGSNAILIARYFKPLFPRRKLLGTAVWFQLHRDMQLVAWALEIVAVVIIFWQAGWVWYECSYECTSDDFAKKMHAITGVWATFLAGIQPFIAFLRPSPDSNIRPVFNWLHWFLGMMAWCFASATFILAIQMGKTGLNRVYGHAPNYIMGGYIIVFVLTNIIMEIIATTYTNTHFRSNKIGPSGMAMSVINGPSRESNFAEPKRTRARLFVFGVHFIISLGVAITITVMLVRILYMHSD